MRKKIKADSVDELFEIVKAIQNGEEPEAYVKRRAQEEKEAQKRKTGDSQENEKQREAGRAAASHEVRQKKSVERQNAEKRKETKADDEAFERLLADESEDEMPAVFALAAEKLNNAGRVLKEKAQSAAGSVGKTLHEQPGKKNQQKDSDRKKEADVQAAHKEHRPAEGVADTEKNSGGRTHRRYGAKSVSEEAETVGQRILRSLHMESPEEKKAEHPASASAVISPDENEMDSIDLDTVQILDRLLDGSSGKTSENSTIDAEVTSPASSAAQEGASAVAGTKRYDRLGDLKETPVTPDVKSYLHRILSRLEEKGIGRKQLQIMSAAALIAVVALVIILCALAQTMNLHRKQEYVTADAGLVITVESQPKEWCSSGELKLKVKVKSGTISSIEIDGNFYEADENGLITVEVQEYLADVTVTTDEGTLTAQIEIPMLDASAPVVSVDKSQGKITVAASDARSGVASIWYAWVGDDDWLSLPSYQLYTEAIPYEEGGIYYFYALDQAGNKSSPIVTTLITAEALSLSETELTLFPGDTATLTAEVSPVNSYVADLRYESSNTDVVTVSSSGLVTAVAEGGALIKVTADDLGTVTCSVTVVSEQTVSISVIGDCTLGTYVGANTSTSFDTYYAMYGATYFFENVRDILENDDITFANLEGTLTDETTPEDKTYAFKGDPSYTEILLDGSIEVVTLANNHSSDYGAQSLVDTKDNLTSAGIAYCIGDTIAYEEVSGVKVAFIGIYELASGMDCESQVRETIAEAQAEDAQLIIVAFHWGTEKETAADETQQTLAHIAVDCGADLVVGHHPHVLQGIEKYNGKYIVYSLGNFCFGGNTNPSDKATMIFRQTFTVSQDGAADDDKIEIIPCTLSSQTSYNDYRPTPATGTTATEIMERINEYSSVFGEITYTASSGL